MGQATCTANKKIPFFRLIAPWSIFADLRRHGSLIYQFARRDVLLRYRGSYLGVFWSLLRPLCMMLVFTVVFGYIFEGRFLDRPDESKFDFALAIFCGLVFFNYFADCLSRAPTLVLSHANYVTKVVFPLEILPVAVVASALVQAAVSLVPLFVGIAWTHGGIPLSSLCLPALLVSITLTCLGLTWLIASLGVFLRDINSFIPVLVTILMYASAIFYPIARVPAELRPLVAWNPLAVVIEQSRSTLLLGQPFAWGPFVFTLLVGLALAVLGYAFFMRTKRAFADVM